MTPALDLNRPDAAQSVGGELASSSTALARRLETSTAITTRAECEQAVLDRQDLGEAMKRVVEFFAPIKKMAYDLHRALCDRERAILSPLSRVDAAKREAISRFNVLQERARREEERLEVDRRRREREAIAAEEASHLERIGDHAMAEAVLEEAITAPDPVVILPSIAESVEGLKFRRRWAWRFAGGPKDVDATPPEIRARALRLIPREFLCLDERKVGAYARDMRDTGSIPGIEIYAVDDPVR